MRVDVQFEIIVPTGIGFDSITPHVGNNGVIVCINDDELIEKFGTPIFPDEMSNEALINITGRFGKHFRCPPGQVPGAETLG